MSFGLCPSAGGNAVHEMAVQLQRAGERVDSLVILPAMAGGAA